MKSYDENQVEWHKLQDARTVRVGEAQGKVTHDIKKDDDLKISIDKLQTMRFFPGVDLKKGDLIRVTIEKI